MHDLLLRVRDHDQVGGGRGTGWCDVAVTADDHHRVADLAAALARHLHRPAASTIEVERTGRVVAADEPLTAVDLLSGDVILLDPGDTPASAPADRRKAPPPDISDYGSTPVSALALDVTAGPESGRTIVLRVGETTVGRSSRTDVALADPSVSRHHATLIIDASGETSVVACPDTANGVTVDGVPTPPGEITSVAPGAVLAFGGTRAVVRRFERQPCERIDRLGQIDFHRTPYRPPTVAPVAVAAVGPIPTRPEPRRVQLIAVVAPLLAGFAMYLVTRQAMFLLFTLVSPVMMIGTAIDDRRTGRRSVRRQLAAFRIMLAERRAEFEALAAAEHRSRATAAPDLAELVRRAEFRTIDLWARGRSAPDFLRLRLGLGPGTAGFDVELATGGDDDLRAEAETALDGVDRLTGVPINVDLTRDVFAVHGAAELVDGVAASLVVQTATMHSPDDLTLVAAVAAERGLGWMKWLPHTRSVTSPVTGPHLAHCAAAVDALLDRLIEMTDLRSATDRSDRGDRSGGVRWPRVLVVLDAELRPDPVRVARLLDLAPHAAVSVVWLAGPASAIPRQASAILRVRHDAGARMVGILWSTDPSVADVDLDVEHLRSTIADRAARALAPVRDASTASATTSIPRLAPLLDVLGDPSPTGESILDAWRSGRHGYHLRFPIGIGADGPIELDLVADGPHTLIGGTSGSGKSELLQSMVTALAARHGPDRLNFLFVDYKGGASSQVFERLPHTVGYVTNLSAGLARRALISLRAELERRMSILEARAKDLAELLDRAPDEAPPSLVIVVDEFATLVKEIPEFVAGIVDIAQRGRSLGIHLVLATQRPTGSVNENILANTNLRIALRMLDRSDSSSVIACADAADIPVPLRGRGFVRLGPRSLVEFQSSFAGAPLRPSDDRAPVLVGPFDGSAATSGSSAIPATSGRTHLDAVIDAVIDANQSLQLAPPPRPWRDVLPPIVTLDSLVSADPDLGIGAGLLADPGRSILIGMLDAPETQEQRPALVDLERAGGLAVYGTGGSGKTTLLRTIALGLDRASLGGDAREASTLVFDFASRGLASLRGLASVVGVATGDDLEAVTRHLLVLDTELRRRRSELADHGSEHLSAYLRDHPDRPIARIVVLVDGFNALAETLLDPLGGRLGGDDWNDIVHRLVIEGRQVGIHTVLTSDRRNGVPSRIQSSIGARLVLRHADVASYGDLGVTAARAAVLDEAPGRALLDGATTVQLAVVSSDPSARAQGEAIARAAAVRPAGVVAELASSALPERLDERPPGSGAGSCIGVADITGAAVELDIEWSHATIAGPPRSGRSTALAAFLTGLDEPTRRRAYVVGPASSPLAELGWPTDRSRFGRADQIAALLDRAANDAAAGDPDDRVIIVIDDVDGLDDVVLGPVYERLLASDGVRFIASVEFRSMSGYTTSALVNELRRARRLVLLRPDDAGEFLQVTGFKLPLRPGLRLVPGRAILVADRRPTVIQVATP